MRPSLKHSLANLAQSALLLAGMGAIGWVTLSALLSPELAGVFVGAMLGAVLAASSAARRAPLRLLGAREISRREFPEGVELLERLAGRAELPRAPALYHLPAAKPNAFAVGDREDSAICVSEGMLRLLGRRELAGVLAHEVSHIANRDLWIMGLADAMTRLIWMVSWVGRLMLIVNLPLFLLGLATVPWIVPILLVVAPAAMSLLQLSLSRIREYEADRGAARLTGDPGALASALRKLEGGPWRFWEDMLMPRRNRPEPSLLRTHPSTEARIARLRELARSEAA